MTSTPVIIALIVMVIAIILYKIMPAVIDYTEPSFLWVAGAFVFFWALVSVYLYTAIPSVQELTARDSFPTTDLVRN